jgi:hypothetical protein
MSFSKEWPGEGWLGAAARAQPPRQQWSAIAKVMSVPREARLAAGAALD